MFRALAQGCFAVPTAAGGVFRSPERPTFGNSAKSRQKHRKEPRFLHLLARCIAQEYDAWYHTFAEAFLHRLGKGLSQQQRRCRSCAATNGLSAFAAAQASRNDIKQTVKVFKEFFRAPARGTFAHGGKSTQKRHLNLRFKNPPTLWRIYDCFPFPRVRGTWPFSCRMTN